MPDSFQPEITTAARVAVAGGMAIAGGVVGCGASRQVDLPWLFSIFVGLVVGAIGGAIAWQKPELFSRIGPEEKASVEASRALDCLRALSGSSDDEMTGLDQRLRLTLPAGRNMLSCMVAAHVVLRRCCCATFIVSAKDPAASR
jgi:hypothetical protein